ncbi:response regulator transcription factor [Hyalangium sp.]|uniref:response regulator transcription factor n=1 Tax=Hyalangium sp. TaxID=2028555 RepID=UPI002D65B542|nr:LuxR C-terminal-related transcriptional regulator [Hyalangium sp.]HYH96343.1 LuxR C-terminal-related transcriptional regulator [Hyalangium sp.]
MKPEARCISEALLELYFADGLDAETRARCDALLADSPVDRERLEELRAEAAAMLARHPAAAVVARFQREREHTFTEQERARLQTLSTNLKERVRGKEAVSSSPEVPSFLDTFFLPEAIVLTLPPMVVSQTLRATELLKTWFAPVELGPQGLPVVLLERLRAFASAPQGAGDPQEIWERQGLDRRLKVAFRRMQEQEGRKLWALFLHEEVRVEELAVPQPWREVLTSREVQVMEGVLKGWDNELLAEHLKCSVGTVKKHVQRIFDKLGVGSRSALIEKAARTQRSEGRKEEPPRERRGGKGIKKG